MGIIAGKVVSNARTFTPPAIAASDQMFPCCVAEQWMNVEVLYPL